MASMVDTVAGTSIGLIFKKGIVLAVSSRLTKLDGSVIVSDRARNYYQLSPKHGILCTFTGFFEDWFEIFRTVRETEPTTPKEAAKRVGDYMVQHLHRFVSVMMRAKEEYGEYQFGMLIAGYNGREYELYRVSLDNESEISNFKVDNYTVLGTGGEPARSFLVKKFQGTKASSEKYAILANQALLCSARVHKLTGGMFDVVHLDKEGYQATFNNVLDLSCLYYKLDEGIEQRSLYLLCPSISRPVTEDDRVEDLVGEIWGAAVQLAPSGDLLSAHIVAVKLECYFHRLLFRTKESASIAYNQICKLAVKNQTSSALKRLAKKEKFCSLAFHGATLYVGKSSKSALKRIPNWKTQSRIPQSLLPPFGEVTSHY